MNNENTTSLDVEAVAAIRRALVVGLQSYGEIERIASCMEIAKQSGPGIPDDCVPIHPTGQNDTIGLFADALQYLN